MTRLEGWPELLADAIEVARGKAFSETYCCAQFAAEVVLAITGTEPWSSWGSSVADSYRIMREAGYTSLRDAAATVGSERHPALAQRGDVVLRLDADGSEALGVCLGATSAFASSNGGLAFLPTLSMATSFRVG